MRRTLPPGRRLKTSFRYILEETSRTDRTQIEGFSSSFTTSKIRLCQKDADSPKEATPQPSNFSFVERSLPW